MQVVVKLWDGQYWNDVGGDYRVGDDSSNGPLLTFTPDAQAPVVAYTDTEYGVTVKTSAPLPPPK